MRLEGEVKVEVEEERFLGFWGGGEGVSVGIVEHIGLQQYFFFILYSFPGIDYAGLILGLVFIEYTEKSEMSGRFA